VRQPEALARRTVELPGGPLHVLQPDEAAALPDDGPIEWAPVAPYWAVLWRSGVALAREVAAEAPGGLRIVELGCGLALPSIAAARGGATVLATDADREALALAAQNGRLNGVQLGTARVDWSQPGELLRRAPFDLVLAADVLYEHTSVRPLLDLLLRLTPRAWVADPGRPPAEKFLDQAAERGWSVESHARGVVRIHRIRLR
jgi:predicted nicotinamide N-methyase